MPVAKINQKFLQSAKTLAPGLYWDDSQKGFGVRVSNAGRPVAYVFQKSGGRRFTLGKVDEIQLPDARREALAKAALKPAKGPRISLRQGMEAHKASMETRDCRPKSIELFSYEIERLSGDLMDRRLDTFTHATIEEAHRRITRENGPVTANRWVRHVRTIFNTALVPWPAPKLRRNPEKRGTAPVHDLKAFGEKLDALTNPVLADWWRFTLITGLRRTSALTVRWTDIDARRKGWLLIPDPKGGPRRAFELPITTQMRTIFERQKRAGEFVFAGNRRANKGEEKAKGSHLVSPNKPGLPAIHQLRATWASRAAEMGCPILVLKTLLNHSVKEDVTFAYVTVSDAVLQEWAQRIADSLWADINQL